MKLTDKKVKRIIMLWGSFVVGLVAILITLKTVSPDQLDALSGLFNSILG